MQIKNNIWLFPYIFIIIRAYFKFRQTIPYDSCFERNNSPPRFDVF